MRWSELFRHLEEDFSQGSSENTSSFFSATDSHLTHLCARAKECGEQVAVGVVTGEVVHLSPRGVGTDWVSGVVGGEGGTGVIIPAEAIDWVDASKAVWETAPGRMADASLVDVLQDLVHRSVAVTLRTPHLNSHGTIVWQGEDFVDCLTHAGEVSPTVRRIRRRSIVMVLVGVAAWG